MRRRLLLCVGATLCFFGVIFIPSTTSAQSGSFCNTYASGQTPPTGYGAAWDVLSSNRDLLLSAYCFDDKSVNYTVGKKEQNQYIYKVGYYYDSSWRSMIFGGTFVDGSTEWLAGRGTLTRTSPPQGQHYWVGYVCSWTGSQWKCGCRDASCAQNFWQLQVVSDPAASGGSAAGDDTFACLSEYKGPIVKVTGDQGGDSWNGGSDFANETRFDFRGAVFHQWACTYKDGKGKPCPSKPSNTDGPFPVRMGGSWQNEIPTAKACIAGVTVIGEHPYELPWWNTKNTSGAFQVRAGEMTVDGGRFDNMGEDTLRTSARTMSGSKGIRLYNNWVSRSHDDCIENDGKSPGEVIDNLFDGCSAFHSAVAGGKDRPAGGHVLFKDNVIRLGTNTTINSSDEHRQLFKQWDSNSPFLDVHNNVFVFGNINPQNWDEGEHDIFGKRVEEDFLKTCSGNLMLWTSNDPLNEAQVHADLPSGCVKQILKGSAATQAWLKIKQNWINCHPLVPRIFGDPQSNPNSCQANAYGGGQGGTQIPN